MRCGFRPRIVIDRPRAWKRLKWVLGHFGRGVGLQQKRAFAVTRLTVGVSNDLQMARNLTSGPPVLYQGRLASLGPFRERSTPAHEKENKRGTPEEVGVSDCKTDNGENARMHETNTYAK